MGVVGQLVRGNKSQITDAESAASLTSHWVFIYPCRTESRNVPWDDVSLDNSDYSVMNASGVASTNSHSPRARLAQSNRSSRFGGRSMAVGMHISGKGG